LEALLVSDGQGYGGKAETDETTNGSAQPQELHNSKKYRRDTEAANARGRD
jgi:hypothetical protein